MNKIILTGRLVKDPEIRYSAGENPTAVARYTLAVDRLVKREGEPTADFIRCVTFGKPAAFAGKHLTKGIKIAVTGRIKTGFYIDKNGQKVYMTDIVVESQEFCENKPKPAAATSGSGFNNNVYPDVPEEESYHYFN